MDFPKILTNTLKDKENVYYLYVASPHLMLLRAKYVPGIKITNFCAISIIY